MKKGHTLVPRYRLMRLPDRVISSFKWLGFSWDAIWANHRHVFVQFGDRPKKFIFYNRGAKLPTFILSVAYKAVFKRQNLRAGIVLKPQNFEKLWRKNADCVARPRS